MGATFVIGNRREGYSYSHGPHTQQGSKGEPWSTQVWLNGEVRRRDYHHTAAEAINYCHDRYRGNRAAGLKVKIHRRAR